MRVDERRPARSSALGGGVGVGGPDQEQLGRPLVDAVGGAVVAGRRTTSTAWKLVPPKPKALTPARRSARRPTGRGRSRNRKGLVVGVVVPGWARRGCRWAAARRGGAAVAALMSPASPAAHLVWPICDFTEPSAHAPGGGAVLGEDLGEGGQLGAVADDRAGAVGLDQADRRRASGRPGRRPGRSARCWPSLRGAVRPRWRPSLDAGDGVDDGVDAVAVALGVGEALEHDAGDALAEDDAVGARVEGAALAGRRQRVDRRRTAGSR